MGVTRLTLISDPTPEFPGNTNSHFKVRLPVPLVLTGPGWRACLVSVSVPDGTLNAVSAQKKFQMKQAQVTAWDFTFTALFVVPTTQSGPDRLTCASQHHQDIYHYHLQLVPGSTDHHHVRTGLRVELDDVMRPDHRVLTGREFWGRVVLEKNRETQRILSHILKGAVGHWNRDMKLLLKKTWRPQLSMEGDTLIFEGVVATDSTRLNRWRVIGGFAMATEVAAALGFLVKDTSAAQGYVLGRNVSYEFEEVDTTDTAVYTGTDSDGDHWRGKSYRADADHRRGVPEAARVELFRVGGDWVTFYNRVTWRFSDLDASFARLTGHAKETVMIYTDLVQPTVVGGQLAPLLQTVPVNRVGSGRWSWESEHRQWLPVRQGRYEILEVELSRPVGDLEIFSGGQTLVTLELRRDGV